MWNYYCIFIGKIIFARDDFKKNAFGLGFAGSYGTDSTQKQPPLKACRKKLSCVKESLSGSIYGLLFFYGVW